MIRRIFLGILAIVGGAGMLAVAESSLPASYVVTVQTLLRHERVYPGEIDGVFATETVAAIRRYQIIHGLRVTGRLDEATLAAMHLPPPPSSSPPSVAEEDRKFLQQQLATPAPRMVGEAPPQPRPRATASPTPVTQEAVRRFLEGYLEAASRKDIAYELAYFAPIVDYRDKGSLSGEALRTELRRSREKRPGGSSELSEIRSVSPVTSERPALVVQYAVRFRPPGRKKRAPRVEAWEASLVSTPEGSLKIAALHQLPSP